MEIFLAVLIVACLAFAAAGYWFTRKLQDDGGYYYIGGPNGGGANRFFSKHPDAHKIFNTVDRHGDVEWNANDIQELFSMGVKAVFRGFPSNSLLVITNEMALAYGKPSKKDTSAGTKGQLFAATHKDEFLSLIQFDELMAPEASYVTPIKEKSVTGQAMAGAVVAGGIGAIVGAVDAMNSNIMNKDKVEVHYLGEKSTGIGFVKFHFKLASNHLILEEVFLAPELENDIDIMRIDRTIRQVCNICWK